MTEPTLKAKLKIDYWENKYYEAADAAGLTRLLASAYLDMARKKMPVAENHRAPALALFNSILVSKGRFAYAVKLTRTCIANLTLAI